MTLRHLLGLAARHVEERCFALAASLALWREQHAPETIEPVPDLWPKVEAAITPPAQPIVGFCCGQAFTTFEQHHAHAVTCRLTFSAPVILEHGPRREARA